MPEVHRLLIVANRTCPCPGLVTEITDHLGDRHGYVHIVAPALNSRLKHWTSDVDAAIAEARERLATAIALFADAGIRGTGEVGDADPLVAIDDALVGFDAHHVLISTWPEGRSNWLERNLLHKARERLVIPVDHVVSRYGLQPEGAQAA